MSSIEGLQLGDPERGMRNYADFLVPRGAEIPEIVKIYVDENNAPYRIVPVDPNDYDRVRMLTNTGIYDYEDLMLSVLKKEFPPVD